MKPSRKRKPKVAELQTEQNVTSVCTAVKKSVKRPSGRRCNAIGQNDKVLVEKDQRPCSAAHALCPQLPDLGIYSLEKTTKSPLLKLDETLHPSGKIKLQLFPMDEGTRIGLERDGYHPYLELTLRARKKISSVLKHLSGKWGSSSIALGDPTLFPYDLWLDKMGSQRRWNLYNADINAGDVYAAVGSPAIFRLRYGWLCNNKPESFGISSTFIAFKACSQSEEVPKGCKTYMYNRYGVGRQLDKTSVEFQPNKVTEGTNAVDAEKKPLDLDVPVDAVDDKFRMDNISGQSSVHWDDSLTNISIGGLLSEASLQGKFSICDPKSDGSNLGLQPTQVISDSFDAFIASQLKHPQGPRSICHDSHSSILDAEETCHAFSFQKLSPSCKDVRAGSTNSGAGILDAVSKSIRFPNLAEINSQAGVPQDHAHQEAKTDLSLCSQVYNDESSLGLRGIKWTDSLGPFDIGLSSLGKIISGDSI